MKKNIETISFITLLIGITLFFMQFITKEGVMLYPISRYGIAVIIISVTTYFSMKILNKQDEIIEKLNKILYKSKDE